jgi:plasmid stability protein
MHQLLIRDLQTETVQRLKARAKRHGRSLQGEVKAILEAAAGYSMEEAQAVSQDWAERLAGREFSDSAGLIREDRER